MGLFDYLAQRRGYSKGKQGSQYPAWALDRAELEGYSFPKYVDNSNKLSYFQRVSWVNIAVDKVATIGSGASWNVKRREGEDTVDVPNHDFERLMRQPNPTMSQSDLIYATMAYMSVCNTAYWWINYVGKKPVELWLIPTKNISPIPDGKMYVKGYEYDPGDGHFITLLPEEVVPFVGFNPDSMFTGMSNLDPLTTVMDSDIAMQSWNKRLFGKNNGRLPGILAFADPIADEDWSMIQKDVDKAAAMRSFMMLRNVKAGGVQWLQATASQKDMEFLNSRLANRDEIYSAIAPGLSSMLSVNATEANARIGKSTLIDFKVYPMLKKIADVVTTKIMPAYGTEFVFEPEDIRITDKVMLMQEMAEFSKTHTVDEVRTKYWQSDPLEDKAIGGKLVAAAQSGGAPAPLPVEDKPEEITPVEQVDVDAEEPEVETDKKAKDVYPAMQELDKWERKQKKAGKAVDFVAYNIPSEIVECIKKGTSFAEAREMLKASAKPVEMIAKDDSIDKVIKMLEMNLQVLEKDVKAGDPANYNFPITVNVPPATVNTIPAPEVTVNVDPTPIENNVNVEGNTINVPEQPTPNVNIDNKVIMPKSKRKITIGRNLDGSLAEMTSEEA